MTNFPGTQIASSTGGVITFTKTGLTHMSGKRYASNEDTTNEDVAQLQDTVKRGRGRPKKVK